MHDDRVEDVFRIVDETVEKLGGIVAKFRLPEPTWHGHSQCFYKLNNASPFLLIDLAIMKETNRGNHVEAMFFYLGQTFRPMVEVLRMKHCPRRYNYATRYVYYDLPPEVVKRLEGLVFFAPGEMEAKIEDINEWFQEVAGSISSEEIMEKLRG
ncbi:MAG: hypothetical protein KKH41_03115 [Candidatus Thermoplasmatota archaeon]|nr:hypothetical protein [Euryarchaeota archaeon]MBU4032630.1 hypothetical protein [Candidatus Thermoplasmatota archaeon]MBU4072265.1 hypothetical protein [Candidatus Thermoplasmatota archaeon]MBU4144408.1 hypothetical protein [Candidatus Thermoplasmatota archaeon]MBU4591555.1 hypothetical protein [Candidatus Thermoplasmatota archaeon]